MAPQKNILANKTTCKTGFCNSKPIQSDNKFTMRNFY